jgi:hypothetical protein
MSKKPAALIDQTISRLTRKRGQKISAAEGLQLTPVARHHQGQARRGTPPLDPRAVFPEIRVSLGLYG